MVVRVVCSNNCGECVSAEILHDLNCQPAGLVNQSGVVLSPFSSFGSDRADTTPTEPGSIFVPGTIPTQVCPTHLDQNLVPTNPNPPFTQTHNQNPLPLNPALAPPNQSESSDGSCEDLDFSLPPGFAPDKEDLSALREIMKEGVSLVPPEQQEEFIMSVDHADDGEILDFFQKKFKEKSRDFSDTNYLSFQNTRRSPRMRKKPARLSDLPSSSGLKKGFLK